MKRRARAAGVVLLAGLGLLGARPAQAQLGYTFFGIGEFDTNDVILVLGGVSIAPLKQGWTPVGNLQAYWLQFAPEGVAKTSVISVIPSIGIRNGFTGGEFQARVGYAFEDGDELGGFGTGSVSTGQGVVNAVQLEYWGTGGLGAQGIATYNYGSESLWTRGRLTTRIMGVGTDGQVRLGGEVAYFTTTGFDGISAGGLLGYHPGPGVVINFGVGKRMQDGPDATYFKAELVLFPVR